MNEHQDTHDDQPEDLPFLTADQILAIDDLPTRDVPVPEWSGKVRVRGMTASEADAYSAEMVEVKGYGKKRETKVNLRNVRARLAARTIIDPQTGKQLFSPDQIRALGKKSGLALKRVCDVARELSGLDDEEDDQVDELVALQENAAAAVEGAMIASIMGQLEALAEAGDVEGFNQLLGLLKQVSPEQAKIVETNLALSDTFNAIMSAAMDSGVGIGIAKKVYEEFVAAVDSGINPIIASAEAIRKIEEAANAAAGDYTVSFRVVTEGDYPSAPAQGSYYANAHGGTIDPTSDFVLVGEQGPELLVNPGGGHVVSNDNLMEMLGSGRGDTYITTNNYIDSRLEFERMIAENTERIKEAQSL